MGASEIREKLLAKSKEKTGWKEGDLLGTGSTLLNLAITDNWRGGFAKGLYILFVGDSQSGKTFFCLTCFAEAAANPAFDEYRLIYDAVEGGALMNLEKFFGKKVAERIESPCYEDGIPQSSQTVEEFYFNLDDALDNKRPCIYVLDSMDSTTSAREEKKFDENKKAVQGGGQGKGDFADGKAKANSQGLRNVLHKIRDTKSILIIINQTRDNVDGGMFAPQKTRSGGRALTFYASVEIWSSVGQKIKKNVNGKDRVIGVTSRLQVKKNRMTGKERTIEVPIKYSYGIDDLASCVEYLIDESYWKKGRTIDITKDFPDIAPATKNALIRKLEEAGAEVELK